jgi:hypothetical protein
VVLIDEPDGVYWRNWMGFVGEDMLARKLISEEDLHLFRVVYSPEAGVEEIEKFYRNYHSSRFVKGRLVLRLQRPLTAGELEKLNERLAHLCSEGKIEQRSALPEEADEPELLALPRLMVPFQRRTVGSLHHLLIEMVNTLAEGGSGAIKTAM